MSYDTMANLFNLINPSLFYSASVLLIVSFVIWELPRSVKIISEEYTKGLYPETGRVMDFGLLFTGLLAMGYLMLFNASDRVAAFLRAPDLSSICIIVLVAVSALVLLGFLKRFFGRFDSHNSVTVFLVHGFLDFMHTVFFISLLALVVPVAGFLLVGRGAGVL